MNKILMMAAATTCFAMVSCGGNKQASTDAAAEAEAPVVPEYTVIENEQIDLSQFPQDENGAYIIFDGKEMKGWRGYGRDTIPARWVIDEEAIHFIGSGGGEGQVGDGGDIIFANKLKNFELTFDWKVAKGSNSGVFYLAQEVQGKDKEGNPRMEPIYISAPEYQILDNANHPDAKLGKDGNRQSSSLYDMIPAVPQNFKGDGEWNTGKIMVYKGTVVHSQNGENTVEYHLWTPAWTDMLQDSKFSQEKWPLAFELLNNLGGENHEGYIGLQDHGDDVWFKNIRVKVLD